MYKWNTINFIKELTRHSMVRSIPVFPMGYVYEPTYYLLPTNNLCEEI